LVGTFGHSLAILRGLHLEGLPKEGGILGSFQLLDWPKGVKNLFWGRVIP